MALNAKFEQPGHDSHPIVNQLLIWVLVFPPEETEEIALVHIDLALIEHPFNVAHERNQFLTETTQHTSQTIGEVRTLKKAGLSLRKNAGVRSFARLG